MPLSAERRYLMDMQSLEVKVRQLEDRMRQVEAQCDKLAAALMSAQRHLEQQKTQVY